MSVKGFHQVSSVKKMKLYMHIGTEKTGSSFLQRVCAINRDWLIQSGFYFPKAGRDEKRLKSGTISPGNARELANLIEIGAWDRVESWLERRITKADSLLCANLLLSHELLFSCLGREGVVDKLENSLQRIGIEQTSSLLFIRDPVDHAISLYKHRGKNGEIDTVSEWIKNNYSTATELDNFINNVDSNVFSLDIRRYQPRTSTLLRAFLDDWLGLNDPPLLPEGLVNPSLTLSEIELLKYMAKARADDVSLFYRNLLAVPRECKSSNERLEISARQAASNYLAGFESTWRKFDRLLEKDGGLDIPERSSTDSTVDASFSFSTTQLRAIADGYREARSGHYNLMLIFNKYLRPPLGKLKRALFS